nr:hypothetical protein [uncultured Undibacterium sp.]
MTPLIDLDFCLRNQHHQIVATNVEQFVEQFAMPFDGLVKIMTPPQSGTHCHIISTVAILRHTLKMRISLTRPSVIEDRKP